MRMWLIIENRKKTSGYNNSARHRIFNPNTVYNCKRGRGVMTVKWPVRSFGLATPVLHRKNVHFCTKKKYLQTS